MATALKYECATADCPVKVGEPDTFCPRCWFNLVDHTRRMVFAAHKSCRGMRKADQKSFLTHLISEAQIPQRERTDDDDR